MIILGIDPGLANTGWGIVETRGTVCRARAYGCIHTDKHVDIATRLREIYDQMTEVIEKFQPEEVAIEQIYFGVNTKSALLTGQARGAALVACSLCGLKTGEYTPMQIKQSVVGTGAADKHQVGYMVQNILKLDHEPHPDHCSDALAAAVCHANMNHYNAVRRIVQ